MLVTDFVATLLSKWPDFVVNLIASGVVVIAVLWIERSKRPRIHFTIETVPPVLPGNPQRHEDPEFTRKFLRVQIWNLPMNPVAGFFYTRSSAISCKVWITFLREDGSAYFSQGHRMIGRWSDTAEPVSFGVTNGKIFQYRDPRLATNVIDIPAGSSEFLDIAMRRSNSAECIGWNNGIIANPEPTIHETFVMPPGRYLVALKLRTDGRDHVRVLRLVNDVSFDHFRLEELKRATEIDIDI